MLYNTYAILFITIFKKIYNVGDFLAGLVAKTPHPQCRRLELDPWSGN